MKPLNKQTVLIPDKNGELVVLSMGDKQPQTFYDEKEGYFLTPEELEKFIGEVFDKGRERIKHPDWDYVIEDKQELIKQLLQ